MKTITIHTLLIDTDSAFEVEICLDKASLLRRLREIMLDYLEGLYGNREDWARKAKKKWTKRLKDPKNTWRVWKQFQAETE